LRFDIDRIRAKGSGQLLAVVNESKAIESAGMMGAFSVALALVQLLGALVVCALGAGGGLQALLLLGWSGFLTWLTTSFWTARDQWTRERFQLSRGFVENVVGNRTRIAQQAPHQWHRREDREVDAYAKSSRRMDTLATLVSVLPGRGWLVVGFAGLTVTVLVEPIEPLGTAIAIGGLLQAHAALDALGRQIVPIGNALLAWRHVGEVFRAAAQLPTPGVRLGGASAPDRGVSEPVEEARAESAPPLLHLQGASYRYHPNSAPVLERCALSLREGDLVLVEGPSGGGKSTLASVIAGLRTLDAGHVLFRGLDRQTLGDRAWRQRVAMVPQFHENHLLSGSLSLNLLMGRGWPPSAQDIVEALTVCVELGLGALLSRMPAGLGQIIGETGWQLSHGERGRVFLARAMLQNPELLLLDESFGALDSRTLRQCMKAVLNRSAAVMVIAHL
jgi:ATP-binding cassette subfamily B protein